MNRVLGLILARGGSKGIPRKNLQEVGGVPLVVRAVRAGLASGLNRVCVYSDSLDILDEALHAGAEAWKRPEEVSGDATTSEESVQRFLADCDPGGDADVCLIQCTTPFLKATNIDDALFMFDNPAPGDSPLDSVISVCAVDRYLGIHHNEAGWMPFYPKRWLRQNHRNFFFMENGGLYLSRRKFWVEGKRMGPRCGVVLMDWWESIEIDEPEDLEVARRLASMFDSKNGGAK